MIKKYINCGILSLLMSVSVLFSACSNWLDVSPKADMKAKDMFADESGFRDALIGVYALMTSSSSYGGNLSYSYLDVLAQYYDSPRKNTSSGYEHSYNKAANYNYTESSEENRIASIWSNSFRAIANINLALEYIDVNKGVFTSEEVYNCYKGEFLGLRAMLHFDMLRLFSKSPKMDNGNGGSSLAIPYIEIYTNVAQPQLTVNQVLDKVIKDLKAAKEIMVNSDTWGPANESAPEVSPEQFQNRMYRLNYYAVTTLLARVYLYADKKELALKEAQEVIGTGDGAPKFFKMATNVATALDPMFKSEIMFALNIEKLKDKITGALTEESISSSFLSMESSGFNKFFEISGSNNDFRTIWLPLSSSGGSYFLNKYLNMKYVPMLKISELYLIAAECSPTDGEKYLNMLRYHRGLASLREEDDLNTKIYDEYKREFIGEGQLFFYYKRNVRTTIGTADNVVLPNINNVYVLPLPKNELDFGNIKY